MRQFFCFFYEGESKGLPRVQLNTLTYVEILLYS